jgi:hypothetical protein
MPPAWIQKYLAPDQNPNTLNIINRIKFRE